jgi:glycerol-3-phosphate dehydrogenase
LPLGCGLAMRHPISLRPFYLIPWEGVVLVGTTAVEHDSADLEPQITEDEILYLLEGVQRLFPALQIQRCDVQATFAGLRPIVRERDQSLTDASRDHAIWEEAGLLTAAGGKLTTFRLMALEVLDRLRPRFPELRPSTPTGLGAEATAAPPAGLPLSAAAALRLLARYGEEGALSIATAGASELEPIPGLGVLRGELRWCARAEAVRHLDDLLLRRVRVGLTVPLGGCGQLREIRMVVQDDLGWSDARWRAEAVRYREIWSRDHGVPAAPPESDVASSPRGSGALV